MNMAIDKHQSVVLGHATALSLSGIPCVATLLGICSSARGRKLLAEKSGISETQLIRWARLVAVAPVGRGHYVELLNMTEVKDIMGQRLRSNDDAIGEWQW